VLVVPTKVFELYHTLYTIRHFQLSK